MTVVEPDELAEVFEHLGNACTKLSKILKQRSAQVPAQNVAQVAKATNKVITEIINEHPQGEQVPSLPSITVASAQGVDGQSIVIENPAPLFTKKRRISHTSDPHFPKRPPTGYILFCTENRAKYAREHPEFNFKQVTQLMAKAWEATDHAPYIKRAQHLRVEYIDARESYNKKNNNNGNGMTVSEALISAPSTVTKAKKEQVLLEETSSEVEDAVAVQPKPKKKRASPSKTRLLGTELADASLVVTPAPSNVPSSPELVSTQKSTTALPAIAEAPLATSKTLVEPENQTSATVEASQQSVVSEQGEKKKKKKKKLESTEDSQSADLITQPTQVSKLPVIMESQPLETQIVIPPQEAPTAVSSTAPVSEKPKKKKKKAVEASDFASQASQSTLPAMPALHPSSQL